MPASILVIDDDIRLRELLQQYLAEEGYQVSTAEHAADARKHLRADKFDLLVMDLMMPGESGLELTQYVHDNYETPVLMLTAMGDTDDKIKGLEAGADDYLAKPFEPRELVLRIEKILKRSRKLKPQDAVLFGDYVFDLHEGSLKRAGELVALTSTESKLLKILAENVNDEVPREAISKRLNGISERSVDVQVTRLRKKLEADIKNPKYVISIWGSGYMLKT